MRPTSEERFLNLSAVMNINNNIQNIAQRIINTKAKVAKAGTEGASHFLKRSGQKYRRLPSLLVFGWDIVSPSRLGSLRYCQRFAPFKN